VIVLLLATVLMVVAIVYARRWTGQPGPSQQQHANSRPNERNEKPDAPVGAYAYADAGSCATCHDQIAATYSRTGMARSFARLRAGQPVADFKTRNRLYHEASGRHYTMEERGGKFYQRRHEVGFDGKQANIFELQADYVVGSGNHARTFLHRNADGRLLEMPVSWYSERGGYWAMSPGYDRSAHMDFRRLINEDCMSCHNGYPRAGVRDAGNGPAFAEPLPEGIDCQRCHGPGQAHVDAIKAGQIEAGRQAIANPGDFDRERQLETCMQCHFETTSSPLPFQMRRKAHPAFSYTPGKSLADYVIYFDHAPGSGRDDKFEIAGGGYRLRKSACFQQSAMTCLTCHNPHDIPRGAKAVQHYVAVCQSCHQRVHTTGVPPTQAVGSSATCLDCHMPKRRTEDAVHVVMTDHYIQRRRPAGDLLAPRREGENFEHGDYRGEVVLAYPATLPSTPENELDLAVDQVLQGSNLSVGITRLEQAIAKYKPERPDVYYELARAYSKTSNYDADIRWAGEALRRDPNFVPALKELAAAATAIGALAGSISGQPRGGALTQAAQALEKAVTLGPNDGDAFADLGNVYVQQDRLDEAQRALQQALAVDSDSPRANNTMGLLALKKGDVGGAERYFRAAIRIQPDLAEAEKNLGNLLAGRKAYAEAGYHFEKAIRSNPNDAGAHQNFGLVLALTRAYPKAVAELRAAIRLNPQMAQVHTDLGDVLAAMRRFDEAAQEYGLAIQANGHDEDARRGLEALRTNRP